MNKKVKLNKEDKELLSSYERGEWRSDESTAAEIKKLQRVAKAGMSKDKRINIRIPSRVLESIQLLAIDEGIPYQTLISSILYKFTTGRLAEAKTKTR